MVVSMRYSLERGLTLEAERAFHFGVDEAVMMLEWAGYTVKAPRINNTDLRRNPERMGQLRSMVEAGHSLNSIRNEMGMDTRTIKRHFPYAGMLPGGGGDAAVIRRVNQDLQEFLRRGKIGKHRENGFRPKES